MNAGLGHLHELMKTMQNNLEDVEAEVEKANNGVDEIVDKLKYEFDYKNQN